LLEISTTRLDHLAALEASALDGLGESSTLVVMAALLAQQPPMAPMMAFQESLRLTLALVMEDQEVLAELGQAEQLQRLQTHMSQPLIFSLLRSQSKKTGHKMKSFAIYAVAVEVAAVAEGYSMGRLVNLSLQEQAEEAAAVLSG
jgi:hypothetical protein